MQNCPHGQSLLLSSLGHILLFNPSSSPFPLIGVTRQCTLLTLPQSPLPRVRGRKQETEAVIPGRDDVLPVWAAIRLSSLNNKHSFLTAGEHRSPRFRCQHGQVLGEGHFLFVSSHGEERERIHLFPISSYKGTNPIQEGPSHDLMTPEGPSS